MRLTALALVLALTAWAAPKERVVVLTFDDAVASQATYAAPLLKKYGFGATFYVCEFPPDFDDKSKYMTWEQIQKLDRMGFEVANHTRTHKHVSKMKPADFDSELGYIEEKLKSLKIRRPVTFAYPAYGTADWAIAALPQRGYRYARIGGERVYEPAKDAPLLIPSFSTTGTDKARVLAAIEQAGDGKIVVLTLHGVPDTAHPWVDTPPELFAEYMAYLHAHKFKVIALRDVGKYVGKRGGR